MFSHIFKHGLAHILVHITYLTGLALLFPVAVRSLETNVSPWNSSKMVLILAITLIVVGAVVLWRAKESISSTLKSLGLLTFIPGFIFLLVTIFGKESIVNTGIGITGYSTVGTVINAYISHGVPELAIVASLYVSSGSLLYWVGNKMESVTNKF